MKKKLILMLLVLNVGLGLIACSKKDDCDGGCKGWKPNQSTASPAQQKTYGLSGSKS